ncbi:Protein CBG14343 [Caenorhabditis briggsae]|uniref:DUF8077 domain-containing protein n=3 Tax=Caenorhabditis briggsae TaxID=6238 RepID=A0AAE9CVI7_CAEBR|nr:Protein CBG14343 [Caenorhabditis briggsae]ULT81974.1 hypothetical protein L3Y34_011737 [Caenorhabditis briggsae]UMM41281.1 hypothetical protein L5515_017611 [Caenorhabditis briggsae]CAP32905.2 Protein CBG14343 [Caenorhabditis briggsae]
MQCSSVSASLLFIFFSFPNVLTYTSHIEDPSRVELDMFDWTAGVRVAYCVDSPLPDLISPFRRTMAKVVTKYCQNATACNLRSSLIFGPEQIVILEGFPRRESLTIQIKFFVLLPHFSNPNLRQQRPFLPRQVLSDILQKHHQEIANRLGWHIIAYEKYPRFDSMTEFMNVAIIPIVIVSIPLMVFLAYWVSTLRPNSGSDTWMVTGSAGGKNAALRRTMEIIAEQNEEYERQQRYAMSKHVVATGGHEGITTTGELLLNVARLSMASSQAPSSAQSPQIFIQPGSSSSSSAPRTSIVSLHGKELLHVKPRHSRRPSSVEEIKKARRMRGHRKSESKQWKSGSLMLAGFRRT